MRMTRPVKAMETKKRVRVNRTRMALHGGNLALADFQLTPPFGNNMMRDDMRLCRIPGAIPSRTLVVKPPERMWRKEKGREEW